MMYSTCSLNPIENEAVVAEILRRCGGAVQLEEGATEANKLVGECAPGMTSWRVIDGKLFVQVAGVAFVGIGGGVVVIMSKGGKQWKWGEKSDTPCAVVYSLTLFSPLSPLSPLPPVHVPIPPLPLPSAAQFRDRTQELRQLDRGAASLLSLHVAAGGRERAASRALHPALPSSLQHGRILRSHPQEDRPAARAFPAMAESRRRLSSRAQWHHRHRRRGRV